ncbi:hypothetical protein TTHERM_00134950 (macronuclear) [Tetrahymena thermophila SB210]|uniref:Uncharacterized protein n=1 Tax=Tetrahymena thermophila (strain SB210) TaxID=312017 RepID=I7M8P8_TETTS|nr:hypothetical protein TTHERM_00134950 [Tetrahymena thermophila SB210]EAR99430.2 hypothetical protein TTHERM_00134950 [Tetrahymena thermophila SB210]|eukprot:XP_001019675.2 hypothetical protein TTHERM_00134950 [Tetrahymena thermophila SB210]
MVDSELFNMAKQKINNDLKILIGKCHVKTEKSQRNLLNKWFQDSVKNYFLEQYAAPLLINQLKFSSIQEVKRFIHDHVNGKETKFMTLIGTYFQYLEKYNQVPIFKKRMQELIVSSLEYENASQLTHNYTQQKLIRKQFVGLIIYYYVDQRQQNIIQTSFYEIWNLAFPEDQIKKKKLTKFDVARKVKHEQKKHDLNTQLFQNVQTEQDDAIKFKLIYSEENSETKAFINKNQIPHYSNQQQSQQINGNFTSNQFSHLQQHQYYNYDHPFIHTQKVEEFNYFLPSNYSNQTQTQIPLHINLINNRNLKQEATELENESTCMSGNNNQKQYQQDFVKQEFKNAVKQDENEYNIQIKQDQQSLDQQIPQKQLNFNYNQNIKLEIDNDNKLFNQMRQDNQFQHSLQQKQDQNSLNFHPNQIQNSQQSKIKIEFDPTQELQNQVQPLQNISSSIKTEKLEQIKGLESQNISEQLQYLTNHEQKTQNNQIIQKQEAKKEDLTIGQNAFQNLRNQIFLDQFSQKQEFQLQQSLDFLQKDEKNLYNVQLKIKQEQNEFQEFNQDLLQQQKLLKKENEFSQIQQNLLKQQTQIKQENIQNKIGSNNDYGFDIQQSEIKQNDQPQIKNQQINKNGKEVNIQQNMVKLEYDIQINNTNQIKIQSNHQNYLPEYQQIQQKLNQNQIQIKQEFSNFLNNNSDLFVKDENNPLKLTSNQLQIKREERQLSGQPQQQLQLNNLKLEQEYHVKNEYNIQVKASQQMQMTFQRNQNAIKSEEQDLNQSKELFDSKFKIIPINKEQRPQALQKIPELFTQLSSMPIKKKRTVTCQRRKKKQIQKQKQSNQINKSQQKEDIVSNKGEDQIKNSQKQTITQQKMNISIQKNQSYLLNSNQMLLNENNQLIQIQYENKQQQFYPQQQNHQQQTNYQSTVINQELINPSTYPQYGMIQFNEQVYKNQNLQNINTHHYESLNHLKGVQGSNNYYASQNTNHDPSYLGYKQYQNIQQEDKLKCNQQQQYHKQQQYIPQKPIILQQQNLKTQQN